VVSSVDVGVWLLFRDLILVGIFKMDPAAFTAGHQLIAVALILISHGLFNHYGIDLTTKLTDFSGYFIFFVAIVLTIALLAFSPVPLDFGRLVDFTNMTGAAGGDVIPRTESMGFAFLFGLILVCYTITGYDASAHTSEETRDAQVNVPKGMWQAVFYSVLFGFFMVASFVLAMPSMEEGASRGWGSFLYVMESSNMPTWLLYFLFVGIVVNNYLCGLAGLTSASRMAFAFARDGGMPFSNFLSHVSTIHRTPTYAIWVSAAIAWLSTVYSGAFVVLATACAVFLYFSYISPVVAGFFAEGTSRWPEKGPFNLGAFSKPLAIVSVIGGFVLAITGFQPPNEKVFYLTVALVIFLGIFWFAFENKRFEGPPTGDRIKKMQSKIAEIEKKYGEAD
jgi:amino acid transporter